MAIKLIEGETDQATFDLVVSKLREQGEPSIVDVNPGTPAAMLSSFGCSYGAPGGRRCAAGHLFGDAVLTGPDATKTIGALTDAGLVELPRNPELIRAMQQAHDAPALRNGGFRGKEWARLCAHDMCRVAHRLELSPASAMAWLESVQ